MKYFWIYYVVCFIYCVYQASKRWRSDMMPGGLGVTPAFDTLAIVFLGWALAPVDLFLTWYRVYGDAEKARRKSGEIK